jgi:S-methylmethionine-dependent homocysteine/selenocysteine methylase
MGQTTVIHGPTFSQVAELGYGNSLHELAMGAPEEWPSVIDGVHAEYADAGANIIAATWGAQAGRDPSVTLSADEQLANISTVARVGVAVAQRYGREIIASVAPLGDCYGDRFKSFIGPSHPQAASIQHSFLETLVEAHIPKVMLETYTDEGDIDLALAAAESAGAQVVGISVYCMEGADGGLYLPDAWGRPYGTPLSDVAKKYGDSDRQFFGANCINPALAIRATAAIGGAVGGIGVGIWPNSHAAPLDPTNNTQPAERPRSRTAADRAAFAGIIKSCIDAGGTLVGGCCGTDPEDVRVLKTLTS